MGIYKREFIRDFCLANVEVWNRAESLNKKFWTEKKQPHQPYLVFHRINNVVEVYYDKEGFEWLFDELLKKVKEDNFLVTLREEIRKKISPYKEIVKEKKVLEREELIEFLEFFEETYSYFEAMWFLSIKAEKLEGINIKPLIEIRDETDYYTPNTELVIRNSIEHCYPELKGYEDVILISEIKENKLPNIEELKKRKQEYIFTNNELLVGMNKEEAEKKFNIQFEKDAISDSVKGQVAYKGKVTGKVNKIMSYKEVNKMNEGDILVASMTMPDIMPAIRKAGAIVTEEGGMLALSAIISRELKIPCIVGAKSATKIFKDGDIVEVDANHGIIKKIK